MAGYIKRFAARFGINDIQPSARLSNTRRALAMAEFARDQMRLDIFRSRVMDAYWKEGANIEDDDILHKLAITSGLDPGSALAATSNQVYLQRIDQTRRDYKKLQVGGIPAFIFPAETVEGCQPYPVIVEAATNSGATRKT